MSSFNPQPSVEFNNTLGAYIICSSFMCMLFGMSFAQTVYYFRNYKDDKVILKNMVLAILFLELCHTFLVIHIVYEEDIIRHGNILLIFKPTWSMSVLPISAVAANIVIRVFFGLRVWRLSGSLYMYTFLVLLSIFPLGLAIYDLVVFLSISTLDGLAKAHWSFYLWFGADILADIIIASYMVSWLRGRRIQDTFSPGKSDLLKVLMTYSISTGLMTVVLYVACLILLKVMPDNFVWQGVYVVIPQVYINSMLVSLNSRNKLWREHIPCNGNRLEVHELTEIRLP